MAETVSSISHEEEISQLKKKLVEAVHQREQQAEKERSVMRGLVGKIKVLDEEKTHLIEQLEKAQSLMHDHEPEEGKSMATTQRPNGGAEHTLRKDNASLKNQVEELLLEKEESKKSLLHFMNKADETEQELVKLQYAAGADQEELDKLRRKNATLEEKVVQLINEKVHLEEKAQAHEDATTIAEKKLKDAKDEIESITSELNTIISERGAEKSFLMAEMEGLSKATKDAGKELSELREDKARVMQKLSEVQATSKSLEQKAKDAEESVKVVKDMLHERDIEMDSIKKELDGLRTVNAELEDKSRKYVNVLSKTKKQILKLEKEKADAVEESIAAQGRWKKMVSDHEKFEEEVNRLKGKLHSAESDTAILRKERKQAVDEKNRIFDEMQIKQAEFESSQNITENLQLQLKESNRQIQEANERMAAINEYQDLAEVARQELDALKAQYNKEKGDWQKELEQCQFDVQNSRQKTEDLMARAQILQTELQLSRDQLLKTQEELDMKIEEIKAMHHQVDDHLLRIRQLETHLEKSREESEASQNLMQESLNKIAALEAASGKLSYELEGVRVREGHLKKLNKTLKEEVRKLSKALSEHETTPKNISTEPTMSPEDKGADDRINVEYLKNVILKFLENRSTRAQLIPVLTMMLKFNSNEIRRLQAKA